MKILLVPNPILQEGRPKTYVPLGLLSLATVLRMDGLDVEIFDINGMSPDPTFREAPEAILDRSPDVVGFSAWCNMYPYLVKFAEIIHQKKTEIKILFGGVHATYTDLETIRAFPQIDLVVRGECDHTISDIMRSVHDVNALRKVPGLTFREGDHIISTPYAGPVQDLNKLPLPDYSLFPHLKYVDCISVDIGRGCPFKCAYCVSNQMSQRKVRLRTVENVITIVKRMVYEYKRTNLRFEHDLLTLDRKWLLHLCDELVKERLDIKWSCFSRIDTVDEKTVDRMAEAGCNRIYFGIESGSSRMQELLNKRLKLHMAVPIVRRACKNGIEVTSGFMAGFPQEKLEDIADTMRLMAELFLAGDRDTSIVDYWLLVPFPGTPLFEQYGHTLSLDECLSDFAVNPKTPVDISFVRHYPKVFSTLYHYATEHLDRTSFIRVVYLMLNLGYMRYTLFMLLRDGSLGFPEKLLEHLKLLELPGSNIYQNSGNLAALFAVRDFIVKVVALLEMDEHPIHDLMKFDLAWNDISFSEAQDKRIRTENFRYDVLAIIKEIKAHGFLSLPESIREEPCTILFRKSTERSVDAIKMPDLFKSMGVRGKQG